MANFVTVNTESFKEENIKELKERFMKETNGDGFGCIIEASGSSLMVNNCFSWLRKGGTVVLVGLPKGDIVIKDPLPNFIFKELTVKTLHGRRIYDTWDKLELILHKKLINIDPILTHVYPMSEGDFNLKFIFALLKGI